MTASVIKAILLDALCGLGICDKRDGQYLLEPMAARLFGGSGPLADAAELWLNGYFWSAWGHLTEVVRTGRPVEALGVDHAFWESTFAMSSFDLALRSGRYAKTLLQLRPGARVLDVGCGSGGFGYALASEDPTVLVTSLDGEAVLEVARQHAQRLGISDRVRLVVTDAVATDSLGQSEFDVVVLSNVLHLFDPVQAERLVRKAFDALARGGTVVVADYIADEARSRATLPLLFGMFVRLTSQGNAYTYGEIALWLTAAGFTELRRGDRPGAFSVVTATKR